MVAECCSCEWLSEKLSCIDDGADVGAGGASGGLLLMDCRSSEEYRVSHVQDSIHVSVPSIMMRRLKMGSVAVATVVGSQHRKQFTDKWKSSSIVLYDDYARGGRGGGGGGGGTEEEEEEEDKTRTTSVDKNGVIALLMERLKNDGCSVFFLKGGFSEFRTRYSHLCVGEDHVVPTTAAEEKPLCLGLTKLRLSDVTDDESKGGKEGRGTPGSAFPFPVQVMPFLFLGNADNSADLACLNRHGIRYIVNVSADIPNTFKDCDSFRYLQIPITDNLSQNLNSFFPQAISFIDEARAKECGVLVHCLAGISRSVTVTVAYLMFTLSLSLNDAYDYLRQCKPTISPNFNFMGQLLDFEIILRQRLLCSCCCSSSSSSAAAAAAAASEGQAKVTVTSSPCEACRNTKTYFSSPTVPVHQSPLTSGDADAKSPTGFQSKVASSPASLLTSSPASFLTSSTASSSMMSLSSLTSDSADCA